MNYQKAGSLLCKGLELTAEELEKINRLTRREFSAEELYCFRVVLCDNEVDRDLEQFDPATLEQLAGLFVGKTGIRDHQPSSQNQQARIYEAAVEQFPGKYNSLGEPYCALVARAYMVRTESNRDLILEIEAGIKKEVSVGCSVRESVCSICGANRTLCDCGHHKGETYDGRLCYTILRDAQDAYEWSLWRCRPSGRRASSRACSWNSSRERCRSCGRPPKAARVCGWIRSRSVSSSG